MKKNLLFGLILASVSLSLGAVAGVSAIRNESKDVKSAEATAVNVTFTRNRAYYAQWNSDPNTQTTPITGSDWSSSQYSGMRLDQTLSTNNLNVTLGESTASGKWHGTYVEYTASVIVPSNSQCNISLTYSIGTSKSTSGGEADHVAEIFVCESNYSSALTPRVDKDNGGTASTVSTGWHADRVYSRTTASDSKNNQVITFNNLYTDNHNSSAKTYTFYVGCFAYIEQSSKDHIHTATFSVSASVSTDTFVCTLTKGSNGINVSYTNVLAAMNANSVDGGGGTIKLSTDCTLNGGFILQHDLTINLFGHNLTQNTSSAITALINLDAAGKTLTITNSGSGAEGALIANNSTLVINIAQASTLNIINGGKVKNTTTTSGKGYGIVMASANAVLNINNGSVICSSSSVPCIYQRLGCRIDIQNATISGGSYAISSLDTSSPAVNSIYLSGTISLGKSILINGDAANTNIYIYAYGDSAVMQLNNAYQLKLTYQTLPSANSVLVYGSTYQPSDISNYISVTNAPEYMTVTKSGYNYIYDYAKYTINFNAPNVAQYGSSGSLTGQYGRHASNYSIRLLPGSASYKLPQTITVKRGSTVLTGDANYTWTKQTDSMYELVIKKEAFINAPSTNSFTVIIEVETTEYAMVRSFIDNYMHMDDYTVSEGRCLDSSSYRYYRTAKNALLALGSECVELFQSNADFNAAQARYETWAGFNHDANPYSTSASNKIGNMINNNSYAVLIVVISVLVASSIMAFVIFKKKRLYK